MLVIVCRMDVSYRWKLSLYLKLVMKFNCTLLDRFNTIMITESQNSWSHKTLHVYQKKVSKLLWISRQRGITLVWVSSSHNCIKCYILNLVHLSPAFLVEVHSPELCCRQGYSIIYMMHNTLINGEIFHVNNNLTQEQ